MERIYRGYLRPREYFIQGKELERNMIMGQCWDAGHGGKRKGQALWRGWQDSDQEDI